MKSPCYLSSGFSSPLLISPHTRPDSTATLARCPTWKDWEKDGKGGYRAEDIVLG
jgi:hypothetical protein